MCVVHSSWCETLLGHPNTNCIFLIVLFFFFIYPFYFYFLLFLFLYIIYLFIWIETIFFYSIYFVLFICIWFIFYFVLFSPFRIECEWDFHYALWSIRERTNIIWIPGVVEVKISFLFYYLYLMSILYFIKIRGNIILT